MVLSQFFHKYIQKILLFFDCVQNRIFTKERTKDFLVEKEMLISWVKNTCTENMQYQDGIVVELHHDFRVVECQMQG